MQLPRGQYTATQTVEMEQETSRENPEYAGSDSKTPSFHKDHDIDHNRPQWTSVDVQRHWALNALLIEGSDKLWNEYIVDILVPINPDFVDLTPCLLAFIEWLPEGGGSMYTDSIYVATP